MVPPFSPVSIRLRLLLAFLTYWGGLSLASAATSYLSPRVVPLRTRVVEGDGSRATNYSIWVGTNQYVATPAISNPADASGFHLLVLDRTNLGVITNFSAIPPDGGVLFMNAVLESLAQNPDALVILYTMNPPGTDTLQSPLPVNLVQFGANSNAVYNPATQQFASAYAFIGNPGLAASRSLEISSNVNPDANSAISVVLSRDINGRFYPSDPQFVNLQVSGSSASAGLLLWTSAATNRWVPAGMGDSSDGFLLSVLQRDQLHQAVTNGTGIVTNQFFATGSSDSNASTTAMQALESTLASSQAAVSAGQVLIVLTSVGSPLLSSGSQPSGYQSALESVQGFLQTTVGAVADLSQLESGGYYGLLGVPWTTPSSPSQSVEIRSWTPAGTNATQLSVILQRGLKGWFEPVASDGTGGVDYRLYEIALRPPVPWPVAPNAGSDPCVAGDEACLAFQWISTNVTENVNIPSLRDTYLDIDSTFGTYRQNLGGLVYDTNALSPFFSPATFQALTNQLSRELFYMGFVQNLHGTLHDLITDLASTQESGLQSAVSAVVQQVSAPASASAGFSLEAELRFIAQLGAALDPDPVSKAALGVASACLSFAMQKKTTAEGNTANQIQAEVSTLATAIGNNMSTNLVTLGELFRDISTDWSKLSEVGMLVQGPAGPGNGFAWEDGTTGTVLQSTVPAFYQTFYAALIPTAFQKVYFQNVPFQNPSDYSYKYDCVDWRTVICECESNIYGPPSYDYYQPPGTSDIYMIASPSKTYPASSLMQTGLPVNALVYMPDFFLARGLWNGVLTQVQPQGWTDYQNNQGLCYDALGSGLDGEVLELGFRTTAGRRYRVQRIEGLTGSWTNWGDDVVATSDFQVVRITPPAGESSFFRLVTVD